MATTAGLEAQDPSTLSGKRATGRSRYFVWVSAVLCLICLGAFVPTYWGQLPAGTFTGRPMVHLHAFVFTAWPLLLLSQSILAARGKIRNHRAWGMAGISLATMMVMLGIATAVGLFRSRLGHGQDELARASLIVPLSLIFMFAGFFTAAIVSINQPEWHKRWTLLASLAVIQAVFVNVVFDVTTGGGGPGLRPGLVAPGPVGFGPPAVLTDLLLVAVIASDWWRTGKSHPAWLIGFGVFVLVQLGRIPLSASPEWQAVAATLARF